MLDNCDPSRRQNVDFDDTRLHLTYNCEGFDSDVGLDGIENDRTQCKGVFTYTYSLDAGPDAGSTPFTQQQWDAGDLELVETSMGEFVRVAGPDPETGERVKKEYTFVDEYTDRHLDYGQRY